MNKKPKVIAVASGKGGVGKTFISVNLAFGLSKLGKTLLIDFDLQASSSQRYAGIVDHEELVGCETIFNKRNPKISFLPAIIGSSKTLLDNLYISPSSILLDTAMSEVAGHPLQAFFLQRAIKNNRDDFDYIVIDCPPSLETLTSNALIASDLVVMPVNTDWDSFNGASREINYLKDCMGEEDLPKILMVLNNFYPHETKQLRVVAPFIDLFKDQGYYTGIEVRRSSAAKEAHGSKFVPVFLAKPSDVKNTTEGLIDLIEAVR